jgi:hypothetical protein
MISLLVVSPRHTHPSFVLSSGSQTVSIFGGIIYVILLVVRSVSDGVESAKEGCVCLTLGTHIAIINLT